MPPELVWGYLTNPEYRAVYSNAKRQVTHERKNGRVGPGTVYECFHLDNTVSTNTVLEWEPFSRIVTENTAARSSRFIAVFELEATEKGTRVTMKYAPLRGPLIERLIGSVLFALKYKPLAQKGMSLLKEMIEDGRIGSIVDCVFPMEQAADAHRRVETEQRLGAVVIAIGD